MTRKTIWEILHLDTPTNNIDEIKQAYSKQSKTCNPEENPEEFQILYDAYKQALKYARNNSKLRNTTNIGFEKQPNFNSKNNQSNNLKENTQTKSSIENNTYYEKINENLEECNFKQIVNTKKIIENKDDRNEEIEDFEKINFDNKEYIKIQNMISLINENINKQNKYLKNIVSSNEFFKLMHSQDFQLVLSKYLNSRLNISIKKAKIIQKACFEYTKQDENNKLIESLNNYFKRIKSNQTVNPVYIFAIMIILVMFFIMMAATGTRNNNSRNDSNNLLNEIEKNVTTQNNEVLTYDKKYKITYKIPSTIKSSTILSDHYKFLNKEDSRITVGASIKSEDMYYEELQIKANSYKEVPEYKTVQISQRQTMQIVDKTFYYADISYEYNNFKSITRYIWYGISDKNVFYVEIENPDGISSNEIKELLTIEIQAMSE